LLIFNEGLRHSIRERLQKFGLSAETVYKVKVENESIILQPANQELRLKGLVFERVGRNQFIALIT
jgi:hypothetical protein